MSANHGAVASANANASTGGGYQSNFHKGSFNEGGLNNNNNSNNIHNSQINEFNLHAGNDGVPQ